MRGCSISPVTDMRPITVCLFTASLLLIGACSLPRVHKVTVQQGNVITQEMIDRLKPGMTRRQVAYVMGEPVFKNSFDENRWDYIYTLNIPGYFEENKRVSLYFENGVLAYFTGDYAPTAATGGEEAGQTAEAGDAADSSPET